MIFKG